MKNFIDRFLTKFVYISIAIIPIWFILKVFKAIHSPQWINWIPILAFGFAILGTLLKIAYKTGKTDEKVTQLGSDVQELKQTSSELYKGFIRLEENVKLREKEIKEINGKIKDIQNPPKE